MPLAHPPSQPGFTELPVTYRPTVVQAAAAGTPLRPDTAGADRTCARSSRTQSDPMPFMRASVRSITSSAPPPIDQRRVSR